MQKGGQHQNTSHRYVMVDDDNRSQQYCKRLAKQWRCNNACDWARVLDRSSNVPVALDGNNCEHQFPWKIMASPKQKARWTQGISGSMGKCAHQKIMCSTVSGIRCGRKRSRRDQGDGGRRQQRHGRRCSVRPAACGGSVVQIKARRRATSRRMRRLSLEFYRRRKWRTAAGM
jgi:hypothetical protein